MADFPVWAVVLIVLVIALFDIRIAIAIAIVATIFKLAGVW